MKKILSVALAAIMLLSCMGLCVAAEEEVFTTTSAPVDGVWYLFEETIVSEVEPAGDKYRFVADVDPLYKGLDTADALLGLDRRSGDIKPEFVTTDENGKTYTEGTGEWYGRNSDQGFFVYQYRMAQGATKMQWTATVGGQYGVYVWVGGDRPEADASKWQQLALYEGEGTSGACEYLMLEADLTQFEGYETATHLYIKITDEEPSAGWGGRIALGLNYPITLSYNVDAPAVEDVPTTPDAGEVDDGMLHEKHTFTVATNEEHPFLYENTGATNKNNIHFADGNNSFTYFYTIENHVKMTSVKWSAPIGQQLHLQVSNDATTWTDVYKYTGATNDDGSGGLPFEYRTYDLTQFISLTSPTLFIKIADSHPDGGWGGAINDTMPVVLDVAYEEPTEEEKAAAEAEKAAQEAAKLEAEKAAAKEEAQAVIDQINELAGYQLQDLTEDNYKDIFSKIRQAKRAYNNLSDLAAEVANEAGAQAILDAAEAMKQEYEAILEAKQNEPTEDPADPADPVDPVDPVDPADPADPTEPEQPADKGGINPIVIVAIAAVVVAAVVVIVIVVIKKKK